MGLFSLFKIKDKTAVCGTTDVAAAPESPSAAQKCVMVLGFGCAKCDALVAAAEIALRQLGMTDIVTRVTDMAQIADRGITITPALVVDDVVVAFGRALQAEDILKILQKVR